MTTLTKEQLDQLAEALRSKFQRVDWAYDVDGPSEINRQSWRDCALAVITSYEKQQQKTINSSADVSV